MNTFELLKQKLKNRNIPYKIMEVNTDSFDVDSHVKALGIKYKEGLSTLLFRVRDDEFIAVLRRDDKNLNSKALKKAAGSDRVTFASEEEISKLGFKPGLASPLLLNDLQSHYKIRILVDSAVLGMEKVICGTTSPNHALEISKDALLSNIGEHEIVDVTIPNPKRQDTINLEQKTMKRILSGITPSSSKGLHLGNYLGAVKPQVEFQTQGECLYFIADYHALNTVHNREEFSKNVYETYLDYLSLGIDTTKTIFFIESKVPAIFELAEILNNVVTLSQMKRMHAYKDKLANPDSDVENINMGLFNYPILMAADILVFEPDIIPVGEDQAQHVEVCRDMSQSFNQRYGEVLKIPELYIKQEVARVPGTDGVRKMGKSLGNDITIFADESILKQQIMNITTDPNRIKANDPGDPEKNVIFKYMRLMEYPIDKINEYEERYRQGSIGDVELKLEFYRFFLEYFNDFRKKRSELSQNREKIIELMKENSAKANEIAEEVIGKIRDAIGANYF